MSAATQLPVHPKTTTARKIFGAELKAARERHGVSQEVIALACGFADVSAVSRWEKGARPVPDKFLPVISHYLSWSMDYTRYRASYLPERVWPDADAATVRRAFDAMAQALRGSMS